MKKLLFILILLPTVTLAQKLKTTVLKQEKISTTVRDSYVVPSDEVWYITLLDGTKQKNDGGSGWVNDSGTTYTFSGGITESGGTVTLDNEFTSAEKTKLAGIPSDATNYDGSDALLLDGSRAMTGNLDIDNNRIINLDVPVNDSDAVNLSYVQSLVTGQVDNLLVTSQTITVGQTNYTNASYENVINTLNLAGPEDVYISNDSRYNHAVGTILWFVQSPEAPINIYPESGVQGFTEILWDSDSNLGTYYVGLIKTDSNRWNVFQDFGSKKFDGVISNVAISGTDLNFTGSNGGFNGTVDLSGLNTVPTLTLSGTDNNLLSAGDNNVDLQGVTFNASQSGITDAADNYSSTNVEDALAEVYTLADGNAQNITANASDIAILESNQLGILQALDSVSISQMDIDTKTAAYTLDSLDAKDNKILRLDLDDEDITIPENEFKTGNILKFTYPQTGVGQANIVEGSNVSILGYSDGIYLDTYPSGVTLACIDDSVTPELFEVVGYYGTINDYISFTNLYTNLDAANPENETNAATNWTGSGGPVTTSSATRSTVGSHSLYWLSSQAAGSNQGISITGLPASTPTTVQVDVYVGSGTWYLRLDDLFTTEDTSADITNTGGWVTITLTTPSIDNGELRLRVYKDDADASREIWWDNIRISQ